MDDRTRDADDDPRGFFAALVGDGAPLISLTGLVLIGSGLFVRFGDSAGISELLSMLT